MLEKHWDTTLYQDKHAFVWQYGESLIELLNPQPGERILDLGCGTGQLTEKIAQMGAEVLGIDAAAAMIAQAKANYPHLDFTIAIAQNFQVDRPFDAVFSNATLHWVKEPDAAIACIRDALKIGGRFVAEFGGMGNIQAILTALIQSLVETGCVESEAQAKALNPWYFPSVGEYTTRLEQQGFEVSSAALFDRPSALDGESGLANWLEMFADRFFTGLSAQQRSQVVQSVENRLRATLYRDGVWFADYRRIRAIAIKQ
jgi:trans-aconitate methyltransferase